MDKIQAIIDLYLSMATLMPRTQEQVEHDKKFVEEGVKNILAVIHTLTPDELVSLHNKVIEIRSRVKPNSHFVKQINSLFRDVLAIN